MLTADLSAHHLPRVHPHLASTHPEVLLPHYLRTAEEMAGQVRDRKGYRQLVELMAIGATLPDARPPLEDLAETLKKSYARRPAMVELLNLFLAGKSVRTTGRSRRR